jgi:hypothetical protein
MKVTGLLISLKTLKIITSLFVRKDFLLFCFLMFYDNVSVIETNDMFRYAFYKLLLAAGMGTIYASSRSFRTVLNNDSGN